MILSNKINDQILIVFLINKNILVSSFFLCLNCQNNSCGMIKIDFFEMHLYIYPQSSSIEFSVKLIALDLLIL